MKIVSIDARSRRSVYTWLECHSQLSKAASGEWWQLEPQFSRWKSNASSIEDKLNAKVGKVLLQTSEI
jgi:hypothetical protein